MKWNKSSDCCSIVISRLGVAAYISFLFMDLYIQCVYTLTGTCAAQMSAGTALSVSLSLSRCCLCACMCVHMSVRVCVCVCQGLGWQESSLIAIPSHYLRHDPLIKPRAYLQSSFRYSACFGDSLCIPSKAEITDWTLCPPSVYWVLEIECKYLCLCRKTFTCCVIPETSAYNFITSTTEKAC